MSNLVFVSDLADELGMDRSHMHKFIKRAGIPTLRQRRPGSGGQQLMSAITEEDAARVRDKRRDAGFEINGHRKAVHAGVGHFYAVALDPDARPGRVKFGFAADAARRLAEHRTAAPEAQILRAWPSRAAWEQTAIDALSVDARQVASEVFDIADVDAMLAKGDAFFAIMSSPE